MGTDDLNDDDKQKLQQYSDFLNNYNPKQTTQAVFDKMNADNQRAYNGTTNPNASPEDKQFANQQYGPLLQGLIQGGAVGSIEKAGVNAAEEAAPGAFGRIKQIIGQKPTQIVDPVTQAATPAQGFINSAAKLDATHPVMQQNKQIITNMADNLGYSHPDVSTLQQIYNRMLK